MNFLIYTQPDDTHAATVKLVLEAIGHQVSLWFSADQPTQLYHSVWMNPETMVWHRSMPYDTDTLHHFDVIWYRRPKRPYIPLSCIHPEDYLFVNRENQQFFDSITALLAMQAWWVNVPHAAKRANSKLLQLYLAKACGLKIPETLCSNDPKMIREFIDKYEKSGAIYKPLCGSYWPGKNEIKVIYTSKIDKTDLPKDDMLCMTPGIFQSQIQKQYELRITCFGKHCVAVKIDSCHTVDWRQLGVDDIELSLITLPLEIELKIQTLMRRLGIVFGCIDMIVTPDGEYIFLEVNEAGQFLWIEERLPEVQLLDRFIQFLQHQTFYFEWSEQSAEIHLKDYLPMTRVVLSQQFTSHITGEIR